ncbi:MAG TPA: hypothetical protein VF936_04595, partial [Burkholderiales bacterium]
GERELRLLFDLVELLVEVVEVHLFLVPQKTSATVDQPGASRSRRGFDSSVVERLQMVDSAQKLTVTTTVSA